MPTCRSATCTPVACRIAMHISCHPVLLGFEGSAWARSLGVPLSDLRLLRGSIDGWREGGAWFYILLMRYLGIVWGPGYPRERERVANVHPNSKHEHVKTWSVPSVCLILPVLGDRLVLGGGRTLLTAVTGAASTTRCRVVPAQTSPRRRERETRGGGVIKEKLSKASNGLVPSSLC